MVNILNFTEAAIIEGTKYSGAELFGYAFSLAILLLPIVFGLVIFDILIQVICKYIKNKRQEKNKQED